MAFSWIANPKAGVFVGNVLIDRYLACGKSAFGYP